MRPIDADVLYERATTLEAQALDYVGKLIERDGDEPSVEWKIWSAILTERTAFKHDLMDAPTIDRPQGKWIKRFGSINCSVCKRSNWSDSFEDLVRSFNYCPNCGAKMKGADDE